MTRPKLTQLEAEAMINKFAPYTIVEPVKVLAIRGYYKQTMGDPEANDRGIYDDAFILIGPNFYNTYNGNTDPSKYKPGIAKLVPGLHYFKKGKHGISRPGGGYNAFRPDTPDEGLDVTRDGKTGVYRGIAINIHKGGEIYTNSAGCQTVWPSQWLEFQTKVYDMMTMEGQRRLPYLLVDG